MSVFLFLIVALIRSTTIVPGDLQNLSLFQSTHSREVRLRRRVQDLTEQGKTVYSTVELDQSQKLGIPPSKIRILRSILDQNGQRKTQNNLRSLYYLSQP